MAFIFFRAQRAPRIPWLCQRCFSTSLRVLNTEERSISAPARVRFAPSPTGHLHLGSLRTALYNYLIAKGTGGRFILRIEDTDQKRTVEGAEQGIFDTLRWAGLQWDEGPLVGGDYGPYRQSERKELYQRHADMLLKKGHAYRCICSPKRLQALALLRTHNGNSTDYDRQCLAQPTEVEASIAQGEPFVIRLKAPVQFPPFEDMVYGAVTPKSHPEDQLRGAFQDPIILKSDGMPTYHLANVVDDHLMKITHVVRATEWMSSTPKHVHLYNCFGWSPPKFVHVSLLQSLDGQKLSKRSGDVFVSEYREQGYWPEALNNFVALMGWSHDRLSDVLDMEQLVEQFDIGRLTAGNAKVDFGKLEYLQRHHSMQRVAKGGEGLKETLGLLEPEVYKTCGKFLEDGSPITKEYISTVLHGNIHNYKLPREFVRISSYFFSDPDLLSKVPTKHARQIVKDLSGLSPPLPARKLLQDTMNQLAKADWTQESLQNVLNAPQSDNENYKIWKNKMKMMRLGLAGGQDGPKLVDTMCILGKERTLKRLLRVADRMSPPPLAPTA